MRQQIWRLLGALGATTLLLAGCASADDAEAGVAAADVVVGDEETLPSDTAVDATIEPADNSTDNAAAEEDVDTAEQRDPAEPIAVDSVYDPDAEPILAWFAPFEPGTYRTGAVGTPMSFTATEALNTQNNGDGMFVLSDIASTAPDDRDLVFLRVGAFSDPAEPNSPIDTQAFWPNDDFLGWLENLNEGIIATEPVETTVSGLVAIRVDLSIGGDIECGWLPGECVGFIINNGHDIKALNKGASYRVWLVEQGDEDPLAIIEGIARDENASWRPRSEAVLDTIAFGDIAPNPVEWLVLGTNQLNALGGVEVILPDNVIELTNGRTVLRNAWNGRGMARLQITEKPAALFFSDRPHDIDGNPLATADEVITELTAGGAELTELDGTTIGGVDARVFDVTTTDVGAIMLRFSPLDVKEDYLGWDAPAAGRIWLMDHPDRGLMMISTHAFEDVDEMLLQVNELGRAIVESLTFIDE